MSEIGHRLNSQGVVPKYGLRMWTQHKVYELLRTMRVHVVRPLDSDFDYDRVAAYRIAHEMRSGRSAFPRNRRSARPAGLRPLKAAQYQVSSARDLLRSTVYPDRSTPRGLALYLQEQGLYVREIGQQLAPRRGIFRSRAGSGIRRR